jgi:DNA-binding response OmpR family regulator
MKGKAKILIVEDDTPLAMLMVHVLSDAGCDVKAAHTGKKGMELAQENQFDLITLDVNLPDTSGFDICSELKERHISRHTPIIFISAQTGEQDLRKGFALGAADYIPKPFDPNALAPRLLSHVKRLNAGTNV